MAPALKAVFFDLDGLLVDTEPYYYEAARSVFAEHGYALGMEEYARRWIIRGTRMPDEARRMGIREDPAVLLAAVRGRFREMVGRELRLMPHARETLEEAAKRFTTVLVTNAPPSDVGLILEKGGLAAHLRHVVTREDYSRPKPAPDGYLAAVRKAGCAAREALALEDSSRGVRAAVAAGVPCVAVPNEMTRYEPPVGALLTINSLADLDLADLAARWPVSPVQ